MDVSGLGLGWRFWFGVDFVLISSFCKFSWTDVKFLPVFLGRCSNLDSITHIFLVGCVFIL